MNILLLDNDINYCKNLMNAISTLNQNVRISFIANSFKEILDTFNIDIILADYEFCNGTLENKFSNSTIIYLSENSKNDTICKTNIDLIIKTLEVHTKHISEILLEKSIITQINFLGYDFSLSGTQQLIRALKILYSSNENYYTTNFEKTVYSQIAEEFNIPLRTLKGNISYATNRMIDNCDKKKLYSYLGFAYCKRPGAKTVMCTILEKLKLQL
ncbi:MAG: hypothetical protein J6A36_02025 [Clostridia bacterium]|nr:hypothetical protein [Clostridia bacterium]